MFDIKYVFPASNATLAGPAAHADAERAAVGHQMALNAYRVYAVIIIKHHRSDEGQNCHAGLPDACTVARRRECPVVGVYAVMAEDLGWAPAPSACQA